MLKYLFLPIAAALLSTFPARAQAQTPAPIELVVISGVAPVYSQLTDTLKAVAYLSKDNRVQVINAENPRWTLVARGSKRYYISRQNLGSTTPVSQPGAPVVTARTLADAGTNAKQTEAYCLVMATAKFLSTKVTISLDYGQETNFFGMNDARLKNETGRVQAFNSVVDALNYMNSQGWEFVNAYVLTTANQNVYHYLMRRRLN